MQQIKTVENFAPRLKHRQFVYIIVIIVSLSDINNLLIIQFDYAIK